ncbi:hypothetical protein QR680_018337 [Steinernema hermaphroditum]|uniref:J domain-containing protein n=1 Tax=Steinernema hermaphroditum TaxID=289476 RepID=A0AA39HHN7_9BILA|nr:hypothetical protein QR680_018337 [Steinernema hermaphroditum]
MFHSVRRFSSEAMSQIRLCEAYAKLGLEEGAENVKERFLKLAKKYHPDSGSVEASADKFIEVKKAYELIVRNTESTDDQIDVDELVEKTIYDIRHKAPQHRQYLEFEGYGIGTPSQRHKQYQQYRVARAVERASEFVVDKAWAQDSLREDEKNQLVSKGVSRAEAYYAKKQKTTNLIDRMVEDMIQSSMQQGGFRNLKGAGKPLRKDETNPYIDDMEMRINKILIRNGFSPPWIMKETEIRDELQYLRDEIRLERAVFVKTGQAGEARWNATVERLRSSLEKVNKAIRDFNLIVPSLNRQIFPLSADRELQKAEEDVTTGGSESKWMARAEKLLAKREAVAPLQEEKINVFGDFVRELGRIWRMNRW